MSYFFVICLIFGAFILGAIIPKTPEYYRLGNNGFMKFSDIRAAGYSSETKTIQFMANTYNMKKIDIEEADARIELQELFNQLNK